MKIKNLLFSIILFLIANQVLANTELDTNIKSDSKKLEKDTENFYRLPPNYYNINDLDDITKKTFKPSIYVAINGGWGQQTNMPKGGGTVVANLGYRFSESYAVEFVYQNFLVS
ncbi:hypothetical protein [Francisella noatunensis]|uniref:hypothetical protein n=1 Tax=Francisella noatunensis TaxID=657445 RepID=UPI001F1658F0|nr:hypothetical protein [Francisella noatunensis]